MTAESNNLPIPRDPDALVPLSQTSSLFFDVAKFEHAQRVAKALATSTMVPEHFRGNLGNVLIALNLSERYGADPFMVMQNIYIVHGKPGIEAKLTIARINSMGKFSALRWKHENEGTDKWRCVCYATEKATGEVLEADLTWEVVKKEGWIDKQGSKWKTMPKLMMQYRTATFFGRLYCPEAALGMMTRDEVEDSIEMIRRPGGAYVVTAEDPPPAKRTPDEILSGLLFTNGINKADMDAYLKHVSDSSKRKVPVADIIAMVVDDGARFDEMLKDFEKWRAAQAPADEPPQYPPSFTACNDRRGMGKLYGETSDEPPPLTMFEMAAKAPESDEMAEALMVAGLTNIPTATADKIKVGKALIEIRNRPAHAPEREPGMDD